MTGTRCPAHCRLHMSSQIHHHGPGRVNRRLDVPVPQISLDGLTGILGFGQRTRPSAWPGPRGAPLSCSQRPTELNLLPTSVSSGLPEGAVLKPVHCRADSRAQGLEHKEHPSIHPSILP